MSRTFLIILIVLGFLLFIFYQIFWAPNKFAGERVITVSKGETFSQIVDSLEHSGVFRNRLLFELAGKLSGWTTRMQVGKYRFRSGISNFEILKVLRYGKSTEMIMVTIPEGYRNTQILKLLSRELKIDTTRFLSLVRDKDLMESLGVSALSLEGYLMPNTYKFYWQMDEKEIIIKMVESFWCFYNDSLLKRTKALNMSVTEVLTIASIIEAETSLDHERPIIAGVYYNRLKKGMRLEADPTIQYVLGDEPRRLYYNDLLYDSPYNTYLNYGLPPGPINNPGKASIMAALYPMEHKYIFFVATGEGGHHFSRTYKEHLNAVSLLRKVREAQEASKNVD